MCSNCKNVCGGRSAIAYGSAHSGCGCEGSGISVADENGCGRGNGASLGGCGCGSSLIDSLAKGFACTAFQIARGLDRSLSCSCGGHGHNGCGCN